MQLATYEVITNKTEQFNFISVGKNGNIQKVIIFSMTALKDLYNLTLCDIENGVLNDLSISNNGHTEKILATVAQCVYSFTNNHLEASVYAEGSTYTRTRLYQMGLNKYYDEINFHFDIFGYKNENWHPFEKDTNYDAFLVRRK